jgi:hypothetical protein
MDTVELENRIKFHPASSEQQEKYAELRRCVLELVHAFNALCPDSREKSLAITNLEQAQFWANASIARNEKDATQQDNPKS